MKRIILCFILLTIPAAGGCQARRPSDLPRLMPCRITLLQDGNPLERANVTLRSVDEEQNWYPGGHSDASGTLDIYTNGRYKGAPAGRYKVIVTKTEMDDDHIPPAPSEDDPAHVKWTNKYKNLEPDWYSLIEKKYTLRETTPHEIEILKGKKCEATFDVGKKVRDLM